MTLGLFTAAPVGHVVRVNHIEYTGCLDKLCWQTIMACVFGIIDLFFGKLRFIDGDREDPGLVKLLVEICSIAKSIILSPDL